MTASRAPLQLGAELFGHEGLDADLEIIDTMLGVLAVTGYQNHLYVDLGHVGLFKSLVQLASLNTEQELALSDLYQRKALPELKDYTAQLPYCTDFYELGRLSTVLTALVQSLSTDVMQDANFQKAFNSLQTAITEIQSRWSQVKVGVDVVELRSYHYHTGLMFAVYAPNQAMPLAQGGRYDGIGEHFGRARAATGFSCDLYRIVAGQYAELALIVAPAGQDADLQLAICELRQQGQHVVQLLGQDRVDSIPHAAQQLVKTAQGWQVQNI